MIREALGNFQITPNLTENIMREVSRLKPIALSNSKPLVPWVIGVSTLAVILLMLGVGTQYLSRFQKPYSFDATSEMTVDIIETPVVLPLESKPDVRTQFGSSAAPSKNDGAGQQPNEVLFAAVQADGEDISIPKQQWIQGSSLGDTNVYGISKTGIYRLQTDTGLWDRIVPEIPETPDSGTSFDIDGNVLYVGTNGSGVFHFNLDE